MNDRFRLSPETNAIVKRLEIMQVGDTVTYEELSHMVGGDIQEKKRHHLDSARKLLLNQRQMVFGVIIDKGIKRLSDSELVLDGHNYLDKIKRVSRKGAKTLGCVVDFDNLPNELKLQHNTTLSVLGAVRLFTKPANVKKIADQVSSQNSRLLIDQTLGLFK